MVRDIIKKSLDRNMLAEEEIASLFKVPLFSEESAMIISASRKKSESASNGLAEVHAQLGLNVAPCPKNCVFCSFAVRNKVFTEKIEISVDEAVQKARQFEADGANAGANLLWAEAGSNPRDTEKETEGKRGMTVRDCIRVLEEAEWKVLQGPSKFYGA